MMNGRAGLGVALLAGLAASLLVAALAAGAPGDLDAGFGAGGVVTFAPGTGAGSPDASASAVVALTGGILQVAGRAADAGATKVMVARFSADGTPDPAFNGGSPRLVAFGSGGNSRAQTLAVDGSGRPIVAGFADDGGVKKLLLARFKADGTGLDTTFGLGTGFTLVQLLAGDSTVTAGGVAIDSTGKILVGGTAVDGSSNHREFVARFDSAGVLDPTFHGPGNTQPGVTFQQLRSSTDIRLNVLRVDASDRPIGAGRLTDGSSHTGVLVVRWSSDGTLDPGFGDGAGGSTGSVVTPFGDGNLASAAGLVLAGDKPVVAGFALNGTTNRLLVARYKADGSALDTTFAGGTGGELEPAGTGDAELVALTQSSDGHLLAAGNATAGSGGIALVARFLSNGGLDSSFGSGGLHLTPVGTTATASDVAAATGAKVVLAGRSDTNALLARFDATQPAPPVQQQTTPPDQTLTQQRPPVLVAEPPTTGIIGPKTAILNQTAVFTAVDIESGTHYAWDFDGNGDFGTDGGTKATITHKFARIGKHHVGLRTTNSAGQSVDSFLDVRVDRPTLVALRWKPFNPRPGQTVHFTLDNVSDPSDKPAWFTWKAEGSSPVDTTARLATPKATSTFQSGIGGAGNAVKMPNQKVGLVQIKLPGLNAVQGNKFTAKFDATGSFSVDAGVFTTNGATATVHAVIGVRRHKSHHVPKSSIVHPISIDDCAQISGLPCPTLVVSGDLVTDFPITFRALPAGTSPICLPPRANSENAYQQAKDLGYPSDFGTSSPDSGGVVLPNGQYAGGPAAGRRAAPHAHPAQCLPNPVARKIQLLQWTFGDGGKRPAGPISEDARAPSVVQHTYSQPLSETVSIVAKISSSVLGVAEPPIYVKQSVTIKLTRPFCGTLTLKKIPATTRNGCWIPINPDAANLQYRPFDGDSVSFDGIGINPSVGAQTFVDPHGARIYSTNMLQAGLTFRPPAHANGSNIETLSAFSDYSNLIQVTKPVQNAQAGGKAFDLATNQAFMNLYPIIGGLQLAGAHLYAYTDRPALAIINLRLPPPMKGSSVLKVSAGSSTAAGRAVGRAIGPRTTSTGDDADYTVTLPDTDIGPFSTSGVSLSHRIESEGGGWFGGGSIGILGVSLDAPYLRGGVGNTSAFCGVGGPSGFSLHDDGTFEFGGATVDFGESDIPLGPIGLHCIQVAGETDPFILQGKVQLRFPVDTPIITFDACFGLAILSAHQTGSECGIDYTAGQVKTTWFHGEGNVSLFDTIDLANAHLNVYSGNDLFEVEAGGGIDWSIGIIALKVNVDGTVITAPNFAFEFDGSGEVDIPDSCPFCISPSVGIIVSSKGIAACAWIAGFEYVWGDGGDVFGGCDLSDSDVRIDQRTLPGYGTMLTGPRGKAAAMPRAAGAADIPAGTHAASFEATGDGGAPKVTITDPAGKTYVDSGKLRQVSPGLVILHLNRLNKTIVTVRSKTAELPAGSWSVVADPSSHPITELASRAGVPAAGVKAKVLGKGSARRRLAYRFVAAPGRTVEFLERGDATGRSLGEVRAPQGTLTFPPGFGAKGTRTVYAIVKQNGIGRRKFKVATYDAPGPPAIVAPSVMKITPGADAVTFSWLPVPGAAKYRVQITLSDGRVIHRLVNGTSLTLPGFYRTLSAKLNVVAISKYEVESPAATAKRAPQALPKVTITV